MKEYAPRFSFTRAPTSFKMTLHYVAFRGVKFDVYRKIYAIAIYICRTLAVDFGIHFINNFYDVHLATYRPSLSTSTSNTPPNSCISLTVVSLLVCPSTNQISCQSIVFLCFAVSYQKSTKGPVFVRCPQTLPGSIAIAHRAVDPGCCDTPDCLEYSMGGR